VQLQLQETAGTTVAGICGVIATES